MASFTGVILFTLCLAAFVFPRAVVATVERSLAVDAGDRAVVVVRGVAAVGMLVAFWLLVA